MNNFNDNNLYINNINNTSNDALKNFLIINSKDIWKILSILICKIFFINTYMFNFLMETNKIKNIIENKYNTIEN